MGVNFEGATKVVGKTKAGSRQNETHKPAQESGVCGAKSDTEKRWYCDYRLELC